MSGQMRMRAAGRLVRDPEMRYTQQGKAVCTFTLPIQERKDDETVWLKCTAWEKQAEIINQYAGAKSWIVVDGVPAIETYTNKDGETKTNLVLTVRDFTFCGGGEVAETSGDTPQKPAQRSTPAARNVPKSIDDDSDLPF